MTLDQLTNYAKLYSDFTKDDNRPEDIAEIFESACNKLNIFRSDAIKDFANLLVSFSLVENFIDCADPHYEDVQIYCDIKRELMRVIK